MQRLVGDKSLQPRILVAQPPQLLQFAQVHPTILTFPPMEGRRADVRFPADGRYRLAALRPAHDRYDLLRRMSFSFSFGHLIPFVIAQSLISDGSVRVSQVTPPGAPASPTAISEKPSTSSMCSILASILSNRRSPWTTVWSHSPATFPLRR